MGLKLKNKNQGWRFRPVRKYNSNNIDRYKSFQDFDHLEPNEFIDNYWVCAKHHNICCNLYTA